MTLTFAYADPPYHGMGKSMYSPLHDDAVKWDTKEAHIDLVKKLINDYPDGWVLSANPRDLVWLLPECGDARVGAWVKTFHQIRKTTTQYAWEPVIFSGGRTDNGRNPMVRDWLSAARSMKKGVPGAKPDVFNNWVLDLLAVEPEDTVVDLFPGSGGMEQACDLRGIFYEKGPATL
jgi:hypothetical protein